MPQEEAAVPPYMQTYMGVIVREEARYKHVLQQLQAQGGSPVGSG